MSENNNTLRKIDEQGGEDKDSVSCPQNPPGEQMELESAHISRNGKLLWTEIPIKVTSMALSVIISIVLIVVIVIISMSVADYFYVLKHPTTQGEDDLGRGLVVMAWAGIAFASSLICTFPLFPVLYRFTSSIIIKAKEMI